MADLIKVTLINSLIGTTGATSFLFVYYWFKMVHAK